MKSIQKKTGIHSKLPVPCKITLFFAIIGIIGGCITGHLLKENLYSPLITIYNETITNLPGLDIEKSDIFLLALKRNIKLLVLLYLFSLTNIWTYYYCAFSLYTGFTNGLLLAFNIILHGIPGIIRFFFFLCPQVLLFIPVYLMVIAHCDNFHNEFIECITNPSFENTYSYSPKPRRGRLAIQQLPFILLCLLLIAAGSFIEAHLNLPLVIWYLGNMV